MPVTKYRSFEDAKKSLWQFKTDVNYYKKLFALFELFSRLSPPNYPAGIFKYPDLDSANRQKAEWDVLNGLNKMKKREEQNVKREL